MGYYKDVYLKRINQYGTNIQERIQSKKEYGFKYFKDKSPNKVEVIFEENDWEGVLQIQESSEKEVFSYLLMDKNVMLSDGDIIDTVQFVDKKRQTWIVFHLDTFTSIGYNRYQIVELDRTIRWINDGAVCEALCHVTGSGANLRDKSITEKFTISWDIAAVSIPNKIMNLVMKTNSNLKKGTRILVEDETWKVTGIDKVSVPGVSYITLKEDYIDKMTDISYADSNKLEGWTIQSNLGDKIKLKKDKDEYFTIFTYYQNELRNEPIRIISSDENIVYYDFENNKIIGKMNGSAEIIVSLDQIPEISRIFYIEVSEEDDENVFVIGPEKITILEEVVYIIKGYEKDMKIISKNNFFDLKENSSDIIVIGKKVGEDYIQIYKEEKLLYEKLIKINSIWLKG